MARFGFGSGMGGLPRPIAAAGGEPPAEGWREFTLTAGDILGAYVGYLNNSPEIPDVVTGAVSPTPHSEYDVVAIMDGGLQGYFVHVRGDHVTEMDSLTLVIAGEVLTVASPAGYDPTLDYTTLIYNSETAPRLVIDGTYLCNFVPA